MVVFSLLIPLKLLNAILELCILLMVNELEQMELIMLVMLGQGINRYSNYCIKDMTFYFISISFNFLNLTYEIHSSSWILSWWFFNWIGIFDVFLKWKKNELCVWSKCQSFKKFILKNAHH